MTVFHEVTKTTKNTKPFFTKTIFVIFEFFEPS